MGYLKAITVTIMGWIPNRSRTFYALPLYKLNQITKMQIERARVRMIGIENSIWLRGWSRNHTRGSIMSQNASCYLVFGLTC